MANESNTLLYVVLIAGVLYMVTKSGEKEKKDVVKKKVEAVKKGEVESMEVADADPAFLPPDEKESYEKWLQDVDGLSSTVDRWFIYLKGMQQAKTTKIPFQEKRMIAHSFDQVKTLLKLAEGFSIWAKGRSRDGEFAQAYLSLQQMYRVCEWMIQYEAGVPVPPSIDAWYGYGDKRESTGKELVVAGTFNAAPDPEPLLLTDKQQDDHKEEETLAIKDSFKKDQSQALVISTAVNGEEDGHDPTSVTANRTDAAFVDNDGVGKSPEELLAIKAAEKGLTVIPPAMEGPARVVDAKPAQVFASGVHSMLPAPAMPGAGGNFDSAPGQVSTVDHPPAPNKPPERKPRARSVSPRGGRTGRSRSRTRVDEDVTERQLVRTSFNASNDPAPGVPVATAEEFSEGTVALTGDLSRRRIPPKAKELMGRKTIKISTYKHNLQLIRGVWDRFKSHNPKPTEEQIAVAKDIRNRMFREVPYQEAGQKLFWATKFPAKYNMETKGVQYDFTSGQMAEVRKMSAYAMWSGFYDDLSSRYREFAVKGTIQPDKGADQLALESGRGRKRRKPAGGPRTRSSTLPKPPSKKYSRAGRT